MHGEGPVLLRILTDGRVQGTDGPLNGTILLFRVLKFHRAVQRGCAFHGGGAFATSHGSTVPLVVACLFSRTLTPGPVQPSRWLVALPKVPERKPAAEHARSMDLLHCRGCRVQILRALGGRCPVLASSPLAHVPVLPCTRSCWSTTGSGRNVTLKLPRWQQVPKFSPSPPARGALPVAVDAAVAAGTR